MSIEGIGLLIFAVFSLLLPEIIVPLSIYALSDGGSGQWFFILFMGCGGLYIRYGWMLKK